MGKAIDVARRLEREAGESSHAQVAHFHCESAEKALAAKDEDGARSHLEQALKVNRKSVRAAILAGDLASRRGDTQEAIGHWRGVGEMNPDYLPLVAGRLADALEQPDAVTRR